MKFSLAQLGRKALVGAEGGARFLEALIAGDEADDATVEARRALCRACESRTRWLDSDWCGPALEEHTDPPSCGCLIFGATLVKSKACPQGKW